jgi:oxidase EvaA
MTGALTRELAHRLAGSAAAHDSVITPNAEFEEWYARRQRAATFEVTRIPFAELAGWNIDPGTGTLAHESGRFFAVEGLQLAGPDRGWTQPILTQREIGLLGLLVKEFDGVPHFLMQAKAEPGNTGAVRLVPTVVGHPARPMPYRDELLTCHPGRVLVDSLQSERGAWFLRKRNRHLVVEVTGPVPEHDDFRWLTLGQLRHLAHRDHLLSMETCSVLALLPGLDDGAPPRAALHRLIEAKARTELIQRPIPMRDVTGWRQLEHEISRPDGRYFAVIATRIRGGDREWTQPLLAPVPGGIAALLTRTVDGVRQLLLAVRVEAGCVDVAEFGPTVMCTPDHRREYFLDYVFSVATNRIRYDAAISEEGVRFYHAQSRYLVIDVGPDFPVEVPADHVWVTESQAAALVQQSYQCNIQLRTLLAALASVS